MPTFKKQFCHKNDQHGASAVEYLLLIGLIAVVGLGTWIFISSGQDKKNTPQPAATRPAPCVMDGGLDKAPTADHPNTGVYERPTGSVAVVKGDQALRIETDDWNSVMVALPSRYAHDPGSLDAVYNLYGNCNIRHTEVITDFQDLTVSLQGVDVYYVGGHTTH